MKTLYKILLLVVVSKSMILDAQEYIIPLYNGTPPNSKVCDRKEKIEKTDAIRISNVQIPEIAVSLPSKRFANGQAVIICPGGGYARLSYSLEGTDIASYFNSIGVAALILKYRLPSSECCIEPHKVPLMDAQRAMRLVRQNAPKWNIDPQKIGIMGFSAGGHLASTLGTHFDFGNKASADSVEMQSCRPDFMILMYPVITFTDSVSHKGSKKLLIGENPVKELVTYFSNELQVKTDTPPTFLVHAEDDKAVPVENSILMYRALQKKKIPAEFHILSEGGHGFGLALNNEHVSSWTNSLKLWLGYLNVKK